MECIPLASDDYILNSKGASHSYATFNLKRWIEVLAGNFVVTSTFWKQETAFTLNLEKINSQR